VYLINSTVGPNVSLGKDAMLQVVWLKQFDSDACAHQQCQFRQCDD
jgi:hypothetical protein